MSRGIDDVLRRDRIFEIRNRQLKLGENIRRDPNPHRIVGRSKRLDLADAGDARELVGDIDRDVVGKKGLIPRTVRRIYREDQQWDADRLLGREAISADLCGQARSRLGQPVLHLDLIEIDIGANLEADLQRHRPVVAVDRLHVDHVLGAVDLLLNRRRDRSLDRERVGAGIDRRGLDLGRHDVGELRDWKPEDHDRAGDDEEDRDDDRNDRMIDEKLRHYF